MGLHIYQVTGAGRATCAFFGCARTNFGNVKVRSIFLVASGFQAPRSPTGETSTPYQYCRPSQPNAFEPQAVCTSPAITRSSRLCKLSGACDWLPERMLWRKRAEWVGQTHQTDMLTSRLIGACWLPDWQARSIETWESQVWKAFRLENLQTVMLGIKNPDPRFPENFSWIHGGNLGSWIHKSLRLESRLESDLKPEGNFGYLFLLHLLFFIYWLIYDA